MGVDKKTESSEELIPEKIKTVEVPTAKIAIKNATNGVRDFAASIFHESAGETVEAPFKLETVLTERRFVDFLQNHEYFHQVKIIGAALLYLRIHPDGFEFWNFIGQLDAEKALNILNGFDVSFINDSILRKLGISDPNDLTSKERVRDFLIDRLSNNGVLMHGFNGAFESLIRIHGLVPGMRAWKREEIEEIHEILEPHGAAEGRMPFVLNDHDMIWSTGNSEHVYYYSLHSPEWFSLFVGDEIGAPSDYEKAKQQLTERLDALTAESGLNEMDRKKVMDFFEKYFALLRNPKSSPKVALFSNKFGWDVSIEGAKGSFRREIGRDLNYRPWSDPYKPDPDPVFIHPDFKTSDIIKFAISYLASEGQWAHEETIPPEELTIIDLPMFKANIVDKQK